MADLSSTDSDYLDEMMSLEQEEMDAANAYLATPANVRLATITEMARNTVVECTADMKVIAAMRANASSTNKPGAIGGAIANPLGG